MKSMRLLFASLVGTSISLGTFVALSGPAAASPSGARATLTISGCTMDEILSWHGLPPIYQVTWNFYADGKLVSPGKLESSHGPFHSPLDLGSYTKKTSTKSHTFYLTFDFLDQALKVVATATTPTVRGSCVPNS